LVVRLNGVQEVVGSNPASPSLGVPERLFPPRRFQRDSGATGFSKE